MNKSINIITSKSRATTVYVRNESPFKLSNWPLLNTSSAKARNVSIKDNINKLIMIGTNDVKEFVELAKEFDVAHKKAIFKETKCEVSQYPSQQDEANIFLDEEPPKSS